MFQFIKNWDIYIGDSCYVLIKLVNMEVNIILNAVLELMFGFVLNVMIKLSLVFNCFILNKE